MNRDTRKARPPQGRQKIVIATGKRLAPVGTAVARWWRCCGWCKAGRGCRARRNALERHGAVAGGMAGKEVREYRPTVVDITWRRPLRACAILRKRHDVRRLKQFSNWRRAGHATPMRASDLEHSLASD